MTRYCGADRGSGDIDRVVLPHSDDVPANFGKRSIVTPIACHVRLELRPPPLAVPFREIAVLGTRVPEATVDEYRHSRFREDDVGSATDARDRRSVNAKPQSSAMELAAKRELGTGVAPAIGLHRGPSPGRGRRRPQIVDGHGVRMHILVRECVRPAS